jgi:hypothetical protein
MNCSSEIRGSEDPSQPSARAFSPVVLVIENDLGKRAAWGSAARNAGFTHPLTFLPNSQSLTRYLNGVGIYENRAQHPLPAFVLQDVTLSKIPAPMAQPWLRQPEPARQVVVTVICGKIEAWHFESAVPFGPNAVLCKLPSFDALKEMFRSLGCFNQAEKPRIPSGNRVAMCAQVQAGL